MKYEIRQPTIDLDGESKPSLDLARSKIIIAPRNPLKGGFYEEYERKV